MLLHHRPTALADAALGAQTIPSPLSGQDLRLKGCSLRRGRRGWADQLMSPDGVSGGFARVLLMSERLKAVAGSHAVEAPRLHLVSVAPGHLK